MIWVLITVFRSIGMIFFAIVRCDGRCKIFSTVPELPDPSDLSVTRSVLLSVIDDVVATGSIDRTPVLAVAIASTGDAPALLFVGDIDEITVWRLRPDRPVPATSLCVCLLDKSRLVNSCIKSLDDDVVSGSMLRLLCAMSMVECAVGGGDGPGARSNVGIA